MWEPPPDHPICRMFAGITEHAFITTIGVADPPLVDYVSTLLSRFVHADSMFPLRDSHGHRLSELAGMVAEAEKLPPEGRTRREYHRHIGDFALFWSGLFPESVERGNHGHCRDSRVFFMSQGKRSYHIAGTFDEEQYRNEAAVFLRLSEQFELCAYGLREVRREWEELAHQPLPPGSGLIGQ